MQTRHHELSIYDFDVCFEDCGKVFFSSEIVDELNEWICKKRKEKWWWLVKLRVES